MGQALEKIRKDEKRASICEELKHRLRDEIARGLISTRTIEAYCKQDWKNKAKSKSGRKGAESKKRLLLPRPSSSSFPVSAAESAAPSVTSAQGQVDNSNVDLKKEKGEKEEKKTVLIKTDGSSETVLPVSTDNDWKLGEEKLLDRLKEKDTIILQQQQEMEGLEEEIHYYKQKAEGHLTVDSNSDDIPLKEEGDLPTITESHLCLEHAAQNIEFEFWLPFDILRREMDRLYRKYGTATKIWIHGVIEITTGKIIERNVGRLDNAAEEDEYPADQDRLK
jgi:hypothetical protein